MADNVTRFDARGLGIYCYFDHPVVLENAIESPLTAGVTFTHITTQWFKPTEAQSITSSTARARR